MQWLAGRGFNVAHPVDVPADPVHNDSIMNFKNKLAPLAILFFVATNAAAQSKAAKPVIAPAVRDDRGFLTHAVTSPYQAGKTEIRVLLPDRLKKGDRHRVLYLLPVEAGNESYYGDGLLEAKKQNLHNKHGLICVAPTFSHLPWYADHPTDKEIRQEAYFVKVVVPFIDKTYPALTKKDGRLLVGFSKSGWGAWSLLLRHPQVFAKAAAWDAPLDMQQPNRFGMGPIFGTQKNFEKYQITTLLKQRAGMLQKETRLILHGYGGFRDQHIPVHNLMTELNIKHEYRDGPKRKHRWETGWLQEAVESLVKVNRLEEKRF